MRPTLLVVGLALFGASHFALSGVDEGSGVWGVVRAVSVLLVLSFVVGRFFPASKKSHLECQDPLSNGIPVKEGVARPFAWRLRDAHDGRQRWHCVPCSTEEEAMQEALFQTFDAGKNVNCSDKIYREFAIEKNPVKPAKPTPIEGESKEAAESRAAATQAASYLASLQAPDGHWPADYGGPMFLMPGMLITMYLGNIPIDSNVRDAMIRYLSNHQHADGGWGIHIESPSTLFGSCLNYASLRLLGVPPSDDRAVRAQRYIQKAGGPGMCPSWGKFWLAVLGVCEWEVHDCLFPEMWLLPTWLPFHPSKMWCHARMVYLPMAYCYGKRLTSKPTPLVVALRNEMYPPGTNYNSIDWSKYRGACAPDDLYQPVSLVASMAYCVLNAYEAFHLNSLRKRALKFILDYVKAEDQQTNHVDIGPVNKVINTLVVLHGEGPGPLVDSHLDRFADYLWMSEDGMKMQGYNGSQLWDTAFIANALLEADVYSGNKHIEDAMRGAYKYMKYTQIREDAPGGERWFRHPNKGAWPFSTRDHGWAISDCTGDAAHAVLGLEHVDASAGGPLIPTADRCEEELMRGAIDILLGFQNTDGGYATYELKRTGAWLELMNTSVVFRNIMIDYTYPECTSSALQGLIHLHEHLPDHRPAECKQAIAAATKFLHNVQRPDGGYYGSWAVCFTYAGWYAADGLAAAGCTAKNGCSAAKRLCTYLLKYQNEDGGWGESYLAAQDLVYRESESLVINTAWAMLALLAAGHDDMTPIARGAAYLRSKQLPDGDWAQERISGQFNGGCMITYTYYRNVFPLKALARYSKHLTSPPEAPATPCPHCL